jgi:hypothetical protein
LYRLTWELIGIDYVQENVLGQGKQDNESAIEQAKDEQIRYACARTLTGNTAKLTFSYSDFIRDKYKSTTGSDFPVPDKDTKLG